MGLTEIGLIMFVALILFGPEDLPVVARTLGKMVYQVRKYASELNKEFQEAIDTPSKVVNNAIKDSLSESKVSKTEEKREDTEELLSYEEEKDEVPVNVPAENNNPLAELPSDIVSSPKDT